MSTTGNEPEHSISEVADAFGLAVSALRYYDDEQLVPATGRRGRVRHYDHDALLRLAYFQLWHKDGQLSLERTRTVLDSASRDERRENVRTAQDEIRARIEGLRRADAILSHLLECQSDQPMNCPITGAHLRRRVDAALAGESVEYSLPAAGTDLAASAPDDD